MISPFGVNLEVSDLRLGLADMILLPPLAKRRPLVNASKSLGRGRRLVDGPRQVCVGLD